MHRYFDLEGLREHFERRSFRGSGHKARSRWKKSRRQFLWRWIHS